MIAIIHSPIVFLPPGTCQCSRQWNVAPLSWWGTGGTHCSDCFYLCSIVFFPVVSVDFSPHVFLCPLVSFVSLPASVSSLLGSNVPVHIALGRQTWLPVCRFPSSRATQITTGSFFAGFILSSEAMKERCLWNSNYVCSHHNRHNHTWISEGWQQPVIDGTLA